MKKVVKIIVVIALVVIFKSNIFGYSNKYFTINIPNYYNFSQEESNLVIENRNIDTFIFDKSNLKEDNTTISVNVVKNPAKTALRRFTKETISKSKKEVKKVISNLKEDVLGYEITSSKIEHEIITIGKEKYNTLRIYNTLKIGEDIQYYNYYYIISDNYVYIIITVSPNDIEVNSELTTIVNSFEINDSINYGGEALLVWQDAKYYGKAILPIGIISFVLIRIVSKKIKKKRKNKIMDEIFKGIKH